MSAGPVVKAVTVAINRHGDSKYWVILLPEFLKRAHVHNTLTEEDVDFGVAASFRFRRDKLSRPVPSAATGYGS